MEKIKQFIESEKGKALLTIIIIILVGLASFQLGRLSAKGNTNQGVKVTYPSPNTAQEANALSAVSEHRETTDKAAALSHGSTSLSQVNPPKTTAPSSKNFFASTRGHKYYSIGCSAGKTIKQENRIYFATSTEAENAGYELSSSCR